MSTDPKGRGAPTVLGALGIILLPVLCCGLPPLVAAGVLGAGALGAIGSVLGNPSVISAAVVLVVGLLAWACAAGIPGGDGWRMTAVRPRARPLSARPQITRRGMKHDGFVVECCRSSARPVPQVLADRTDCCCCRCRGGRVRDGPALPGSVSGHCLRYAG